MRRWSRALAGALLLACAPDGAATSRPGDAASVSVRPLNVLLIVIDDVGVDLVRAYQRRYLRPESHPGAPPACTPNIDALASRGVLFTNAWSTPLCSPTRAQILTGKRTRYTGVGIPVAPGMLFRSGLQIGEDTIARLVPVNAALGKWHLADPGQRLTHPRDLGFGLFLGSMYNLKSPLSHSYGNWWKTWVGQGAPQQFQCLEYATANTTDEAIALMRGLLGPQPEPWLLYVAYHAAHKPTHCPHLHGFDCEGADCDRDWCGECVDLPGGRSESHGGDHGGVVIRTRAMVQALDAEIGRLLAEVDPETTAVILIGDNGTAIEATSAPFLGDHAKGTLYQGGINVPLIAWAPGAVPGECHELVSATDLFATVADLSQRVPLPDPRRDSISLCQYLDPRYCLDPAVPRSYVGSELFTPNFAPDANGDPPSGYEASHHLLAIRSHGYKLIERRWHWSIEQELYRLSHGPHPQDPAVGPDPFERHNLLADQERWSRADWDAYLALSAELDGGFPALLDPGVRPLKVVEAASLPGGVTCAEAPVQLRYARRGSKERIERAFLDFGISQVPSGARVIAVRLEVAVRSGAASDRSAVEVRQLAGPTWSYPQCGELFGAIDGRIYAVEWGWTGSFFTRSIPLSSQAAEEITRLRSIGVGAPTFSLGLKLQAEEPGGEDSIQLFEKGGDLRHRLAVTYTCAGVADFR